MFKTINLNSRLIAPVLPVLIILSMVLITQSAAFHSNPDMLSLGVTIDLLIIAPFVYYLLIRKKNISKITVVSFFIAGIVIGSVILPTENQNYLSLARNWVLPFVEITVLVIIFFKVRKILHRYRENKTLSVDFFTVLKRTCGELLPKKAAVILATEIAVFYYGFFCWKKPTIKTNEFTYHKETGTVALLMAFILLLAIEITAIHFLVMKWSSTAAWILTVLSIYSAIQAFGVLKSLSRRPISIENQKLKLYYGVASETVIDIENIASIEPFTKTLEYGKEVRKLSPLGDLESHNLIIRLFKPTILYRFYGIQKKYNTLVLHVDDKKKFKMQVDKCLQQDQ